MMRPHRLLAACAFVVPLAMSVRATHAMDEVMLKSGTRITGKILGQSKSQVFMRVGEGHAVYSKKAIRRIYEDITDEAPVTRVLRRDELPPWWVPLSDLYHEDWVNSLKTLPADPIGDGEFRDVPRLTFRANAIYELNIYGDPADPAAIEIGYYGDRWFHSKDAQKRCRQFLASYLSGLKQFEALYRMSASGGQQNVSGLTIQITPNHAPGAHGGWWLAAWNPAKLAAARCKDEAECKQASSRHLDLVTKSTDGDREWTKYSLKDAAKRYLPLERMEER
ncbi:MAG: hypothetical protein PHC88_10855 [Terrimicrobiaceae bacterium]|nr:hypothetical protein [Terrimicrobiaceae bacterium]